MALALSEDEWASWSANGHPVTIDFRIPTLEDICACAVEGLSRFRHGGVEVGGVLYGTFERGQARIAAYRPLECEHAFGPRFVLSEKDRTALKDLMTAPQLEPALRGLAPVGWYHSHTRSEMALSPRDMEIYDRYFPEPNQIALLVRPDESGPARAGFFFREGGGASVHTQSSYAEFFVEPRKHSPDQTQTAPQAEAAPAPERKRTRRPAIAKLAAALYPAKPPDGPSPSPQSGVRRMFGGPIQLPSFARIKPHSHKWMWLFPALLLLAGAAGAARYYVFSTPVPLSLWVADVGGQLLIEWDRSAKPVREAESGTLDILDGTQPIEMRIDGDRLREGSIDYERKSDVVDIRLRIAQRDGKTAEEMIRFVGQPPQMGESDRDAAQRTALKAEVERLHSEISEKEQEIQRLRSKPVRARR